MCTGQGIGKAKWEQCRQYAPCIFNHPHMIWIMHSGALSFAYKNMISWCIDITRKLSLRIVPGLSVEYRIVEFRQVPTGMPLASNRSTPEHDIFFGRGVQQLHFEHHAASIVEDPRLRIINGTWIAFRQFGDDVCKHLLKWLPKMFTADLMNDLWIKHIVGHARFSSLTR